MTEVPPPRYERAGAGLPGGISSTEWRLLSAINAVGADVRDMRIDFTTRFDQLPERFVPRPEITAKWEESARDRGLLHAELARCEGKHDADVQRLTDALGAAVTGITSRIDGEEKERANAQRWALGLAATTLLALVGFVISLYVNLHH